VSIRPKRSATKAGAQSKYPQIKWRKKKGELQFGCKEKGEGRTINFLEKKRREKRHKDFRLRGLKREPEEGKKEIILPN